MYPLPPFPLHLYLLAVLVPRARPDRQHATALGLFLGRVRQHDSARRRLLFLEDLDDQAVTERLEIHTFSLRLCRLCDMFGTLMPRVPGHSNRDRGGFASASHQPVTSER